MRLLTAVTVALVAATSVARADCTLKDIRGNWTAAQTNTGEICGLRFYDDGDLVGTCRTYSDNAQVKTSVTVFGSIAINPTTCSVVGLIREGESGKSRKFEGNTTEEREIIVGSISRRGGFIAYKNIKE
jgi:hypothetical protein